MKPYPLGGELREPALRGALPRTPRLGAPGGTGHGVDRCKNREVSFPTAEEFALRLAHLRERIRTSAGIRSASTRMANHGHRLLQAPTHEALGRPLRWCMTETARAFHTARGRRGHRWERRYRSCLVEEDPDASAALRSLDRNPVRAGLGNDPTTDSWSRCAASALGTPNRVITFPPSSRALSVSATVRRRHDAALLAPSEDPRVDARDPCWTTWRVVGSPAVLARYLPGRRGRPRIGIMPAQNSGVTYRFLKHLRCHGRGCAWCGTRFVPQTVNDRWCTPECRQSYYF
jgi:putative transposase